MKLIKEELYKIWNRKSVKVSAAIVFFSILLVFFAIGPFNERCRIGSDATIYSGFAAIKMDRELAKEFEGVLSDEVIQNMADRCFFIERVNGIGTNENYVNRFFTDNGLTNGSYNADYFPATQTVPLESVPMGSLTEEPIYFTYMQGWKVLYDLFAYGAVFACLFTIIAISPVFSEEYSLRTASVLLTTKHGKNRGIWAKIAASFICSIGVFFICTILMILLCGICYGFQGLNCFAGMLNAQWYLPTKWVGSPSYLKIWQFFLLYILIVAAAIIIVCAFTLLASAVCKQTYVTLIIGTVLFILPIIIWIYFIIAGVNVNFPVVRMILYCTPVFSCMSETIEFTLTAYMGLFRSVMFLIITIPSVVGAFFKFKNYQAS